MEPAKEENRSRPSHNTLGGAVAAGALTVLLLVAVNAVRHRACVEGSGSTRLAMDAGFLLACALAGTWVWLQRRVRLVFALSIGAKAGLVLGAVLVINHGIELFTPARSRIAQFVFGAGPVLLMIALFAAAGSAVRERTRSLVPGVFAGVWCALAALLILLNFAFASNLVFEKLAESRLQEAFVASRMGDPGAFLVKNSLDAASEVLIRMPVVALLLSFMGGIANAWIGRSRRLASMFVWLAPPMFVAGCGALWYVSSLERAARPPFVMAGVLLAAVALSGIHPVWSALRRAPLA